MTQTGNLPTRATRINDSIDKSTMGQMIVSSAMGGVAFTNMDEVMNFAKLMAVSDVAVPKYLRNNPGGCLAITIQALEWKMSPYAVAGKSYVVNDRIAYESQLIHAIVENRGPLKERLKFRYTGEGDKRRCIVSGLLKGEDEPREYQSAEFGQIQPKNSPLWKTKPDLQLFYNASRDWARVYCPDVILGVYSTDELPAAIANGIATEPGVSRTEQLKRDLKKRLPDPQTEKPDRPNEPMRPAGQTVDQETGEVEEAGESDQTNGDAGDDAGQSGMANEGDAGEENQAAEAEAKEATPTPPAATPPAPVEQKAPKAKQYKAPIDKTPESPPAAATKPGTAPIDNEEAERIKLGEYLAGDWEHVKEVCFSDAAEPKPDITVFEKGVASFVLKLGKINKENLISPQSRIKMYRSIRAGKFDYATGTAN